MAGVSEELAWTVATPESIDPASILDFCPGAMSGSGASCCDDNILAALHLDRTKIDDGKMRQPSETIRNQ
jgi:hypothetical protein